MLVFIECFLQVDVVFGLGVGYVAKVCVEEVVGIESYLEHFLHAPHVVSDMAVGSHEEGVVSVFGNFYIEV